MTNQSALLGGITVGAFTVLFLLLAYWCTVHRVQRRHGPTTNSQSVDPERADAPQPPSSLPQTIHLPIHGLTRFFPWPFSAAAAAAARKSDGDSDSQRHSDVEMRAGDGGSGGGNGRGLGGRFTSPV